MCLNINLQYSLIAISKYLWIRSLVEMLPLFIPNPKVPVDGGQLHQQKRGVVATHRSFGRASFRVPHRT